MDNFTNVAFATGVQLSNGERHTDHTVATADQPYGYEDYGEMHYFARDSQTWSDWPSSAIAEPNQNDTPDFHAECYSGHHGGVDSSNSPGC